MAMRSAPPRRSRAKLASGAADEAERGALKIGFDKRGLLEPGCHTCRGWKAFHSLFAFNAHRERQLERLKDFVRDELAPVARGLEFVVGGSYLSDKAVPGDIDCTVAMPVSAAAKRTGLMLLAADGDKARIYGQYGVEFYLSIIQRGRNDLRAYFQYVGEKTTLARGLSPKDLRGTVKVEKWATL
jgi:hypothetical protein